MRGLLLAHLFLALTGCAWTIESEVWQGRATLLVDTVTVGPSGTVEALVLIKGDTYRAMMWDVDSCLAKRGSFVISPIGSWGVSGLFYSYYGVHVRKLLEDLCYHGNQARYRR